MKKYAAAGVIIALLTFGVAQAQPNEHGRPNQEETGCNANNETNCPTPEQSDGVNPICGNGQHAGNPHCGATTPEPTTPPSPTPTQAPAPTPTPEASPTTTPIPEPSETPQDEPGAPSVGDPEVVPEAPPVGGGEPVLVPIPAKAGNCGPECK